MSPSKRVVSAYCCVAAWGPAKLHDFWLSFAFLSAQPVCRLLWRDTMIIVACCHARSFADQAADQHFGLTQRKTSFNTCSCVFESHTNDSGALFLASFWPLFRTELPPAWFCRRPHTPVLSSQDAWWVTTGSTPQTVRYEMKWNDELRLVSADCLPSSSSRLWSNQQEDLEFTWLFLGFIVCWV